MDADRGRQSGLRSVQRGSGEDANPGAPVADLTCLRAGGLRTRRPAPAIPRPRPARSGGLGAGDRVGHRAALPRDTQASRRSPPPSSRPSGNTPRPCWPVGPRQDGGVGRDRGRPARRDLARRVPAARGLRHARGGVHRHDRACARGPCQRGGIGRGSVRAPIAASRRRPTHRSDEEVPRRVPPRARGNRRSARRNRRTPRARRSFAPRHAREGRGLTSGRSASAAPAPRAGTCRRRRSGRPRRRTGRWR